MKYEHEPRPNIEHHYHIRELIENQEKRTQDRIYCRNKEKEKEERESSITGSQFLVLTDFWCSDCKEDFKAQAIKQTEVDWSNTAQRIAFYKTKCFCGKWCIRLITDKLKDGYWMRSHAVARDRGKHFADMLQPGETGFNLLYARKNKHEDFRQ